MTAARIYGSNTDEIKTHVPARPKNPTRCGPMLRMRYWCALASIRTPDEALLDSHPITFDKVQGKLTWLDSSFSRASPKSKSGCMLINTSPGASESWVDGPWLPKHPMSTSSWFRIGTICSTRRIDDSVDGEKASPLKTWMQLVLSLEVLGNVGGLKICAKREISAASPM